VVRVRVCVEDSWTSMSKSHPTPAQVRDAEVALSSRGRPGGRVRSRGRVRRAPEARPREVQALDRPARRDLAHRAGGALGLREPSTLP